MFVPAPIDNSYVPYTKRPVLKRNAGLFVDGPSGKARGAARVALQSMGMYCAGKDDCTPCDSGVCVGGHCVSLYSDEGAKCRR